MIPVYACVVYDPPFAFRRMPCPDTAGEPKRKVAVCVA
jgi:hypothetical protein